MNSNKQPVWTLQGTHGPPTPTIQTPLERALEAQTQAINNLAASNEALANSVMELIDSLGSDEPDTDDGDDVL